MAQTADEGPPKAVAAAKKPAAASTKRATRRTAWGDPDLQGTWDYRTITPLERPQNMGDRQFLTDAEAAQLESRAAKRLDEPPDASVPANTIHAPYWTDPGRFVLGDKRTSLIIDPPDGRLPALTAEGQVRLATRGRGGTGGREGGKADGPEDRPLNERCITYGAPLAFAGYNAYQQIIQSPETVVILQEMIHDARVVPISSQPHLPKRVRQLHGDSRGRWEGDTFVVETTNFSIGNLFLGTSPDLKLTERYTRVSKDFINWELTVDDPATWTKPWTFMIRLKRSDDQLYEYACHEGNHSMVGMLAGARAKEAKESAAPSRTGAR